MPNDLRFLTHDAVEAEELPRGLHTWLSRRDLTGAENLLAVHVEVGPGNGHPFHCHPSMEEIIYILGGEAEQWIEEERRTLGAGEMVFIPKGVVHATYNAGAAPLTFLAVLSPAGDLDDESGMRDVSHEEPWRSLRPPLDERDDPAS